jgi:hypothetical protein
MNEGIVSDLMELLAARNMRGMVLVLYIFDSVSPRAVPTATTYLRQSKAEV